MLWVWIAVAVVVVAGGALVPVLAGRRSDGGAAAIAARDRYELLGHYVDNPAATTDPETESLLRRARERWNSAGEVLATARSTAEYTLAEQICREGLAHVTTAHTRMGIPGPG